MKEKKPWKRASWYGAYYKWMFRGELPNNFCVFFWNSLLSIIFLPCTILLGLIALTMPKEETWWDYRLFGKVFFGLITWILFILFVSIGLAAVDKYVIPKDTWIDLPFLLVLLIGILGAIGIGVALVVALGGIFLIGAGISELFQWFKKRNTRKRIGTIVFNDETKQYERIIPEPSKLRVMWDTIRNKYCMKIDWE
jgi:hypothetical protein